MEGLMARDTSMEERTDESLLDVAKRRFKLAQETEEKQREREKDDLRFQIPEEQWDEGARRQRQGDSIDGVPTPARPILSISKIDQPIQLVLNQERAARLGISISPLSPDAGVEEATIIEGLYRRIERDSQAEIARSWAFDRAVKSGRGAYRVNTEYDEASENPLDQVITIERLLHQDAVYFDPAAAKADFSDAEWVFITSWMPLETFKREFPNAKHIVENDLDFEDTVREAPEWVRGDAENASILVAEQFYKVHKKEEVGPKGRTRPRDVVTVKWMKMTGFEILEEADWNGKYLPIVMVCGRELQPFDGERRWTGVIGPAKDAQRLYNYAASQAVELAALEPKAPYVGVEGQFEGHESEWQQANVRNFPYLEYKDIPLKGGSAAPPPQRAQVDVGRLGPSMQLLMQADQFIQTTTSTYDPSLGRENPREKSGRAILALQQQSDTGNSHYLQNLAVISMAYEARIVLDLIPKIYDRPGRIARTLDEEGEGETVMLNQPFYTDPESERPVPLGPGQAPPMPPPPPPGPGGPPMMAGGGPPAMMGAPPAPGGLEGGPLTGSPGGQPAPQLEGGPPMAPGMPGELGPAAPPMPPQPPKVKHYDLRKGIYSVAISVGKKRQTALQESAEEIGQILQAQPQLMPILGDIYFQNRDFPQSKLISERMKKLREMQFPGLDEDGDGQPTPEQMRAQLQQLTQQLEMMGAELQGAMKALETEQAKQQATLQKAEMDNQTKLKIAELESQTKLALEQVSGALQQVLMKLEHDAEQKDFDREQEELDRSQKDEHLAAEQEHDREMAELEPMMDKRYAPEPAPRSDGGSE
jgi:hypothetical protein